MCWWFFSMIFRDGFFFIIPTTVDIYLSYYAVYFCYRWCYILLLFFIQENLLVIVGTLISLLIFFFQFLLQLFDAAAVFSKLFMFRKNWLCLLVHSYRLFIFVLLSPMLLLTAGSGFCCQFMSIWNCRCLLIFSAPFCCHFVSSWHFCWHCFRYFLLFAADFLYCFCFLFEKDFLWLLALADRFRYSPLMIFVFHAATFCLYLYSMMLFWVRQGGPFFLLVLF